MKKRMLALAVLLVVSQACQTPLPASERGGKVMENCPGIIRAVTGIQPDDIPEHLWEKGIKNGDEFWVDDYFKVLPHISMRSGYELEYVYFVASGGSQPFLYALPKNKQPYASIDDVPDINELGDYRQYLEIEDVEQGYFEYVVMSVMASQFYLGWHAGYNDIEIVCNQEAAQAIVFEVNLENFGIKMDLEQQDQVRAMTNIEPNVQLMDDSAIVEVVVFTKWGGFYRRTYTISRSFPHTMDVEQENLVEYHCQVWY
jgi:hypothetical protein